MEMEDVEQFTGNWSEHVNAGTRLLRPQGLNAQLAENWVSWYHKRR